MYRYQLYEGFDSNMPAPGVSIVTVAAIANDRL